MKASTLTHSVGPPAAAPHWQFGWSGAVLAVSLVLTLYRLGVVHQAGITLFVDEAYYWAWSREPAWGYFSKPPVIGWLIAGGTALWGDSVLGVKAAPMLLFPMTAWAMYCLGRAIFDARTGAMAALIFISSPMAGLLGLAATTDAPLLLCWTLAAWALWWALQGNPARPDHPAHPGGPDRSDGAGPAWIALGLAMGIGLLSKYTMAAFVLSALPWLWWHRTAPGVASGALLSAALAVACFSPHLVWNGLHGAPTLRHTAEITTLARQAGGWSALAEFLASQVLMLGPLATGLLLWAARSGRWPADPRLRYLWLLTLPLLLVACAQAAFSRANMNWAAPAYLGASLLLAHALTRFRLRWTLVLLASNLVLVAAVVHARDLAQAVGRPLPERADLFVRMRGWDAALAALTPVLTEHPGWPLLAEGRTLRAHAAYAWRAQGVRFTLAPRAGPPRDQFELLAAAQPAALIDDVLLLTQGLDRPAAACVKLDPAGTARIPLGPTRERTLSLWACRGWQPAEVSP